MDVKSQIQALDRTQPGLPIKRGRCGTMTHDYVRHGTTTLFAALNVAEGTVHGRFFPKHRNTEFLRFLRHLDKAYPGKVELHLILDNYGTHGHENVRRWLANHPRCILHFIPTSSSWLNRIERWFAEPTNKAVRHGSFTSVPDLIVAIEEFIAHTIATRSRLSGPQKPKPSSPNSAAAASAWSKSSPDAPRANPEKEGN